MFLWGSDLGPFFIIHSLEHIYSFTWLQSTLINDSKYSAEFQFSPIAYILSSRRYLADSLKSTFILQWNVFILLSPLLCIVLLVVFFSLLITSTLTQLPAIYFPSLFSPLPLLFSMFNCY